MFEYYSDAEKLQIVRETLDAIAYLIQTEQIFMDNKDLSKLLLLIASGIANPNPDKKAE